MNTTAMTRPSSTTRCLFGCSILNRDERVNQLAERLWRPHSTLQHGTDVRITIHSRVPLHIPLNL